MMKRKWKKNLSLFALLCVSTAVLLSPAAAHPLLTAPTDSARIEALEHEIERFFGPAPEGPRDLPEMRCGTPLADEISLYWDRLAKETRDLVPTRFRPARIRKSEGTFGRPDSLLLDGVVDSESLLPGEPGHFRIHYATSGDESPAYSPESLAVALEFAYQRLHGPGGLGFRRPESDGSRGGGDNRVDFYIQNLDPIWGLAHGEEQVPGANDCFEPVYGYAEITNDFGSSENLPDEAAYTATHEYFHLLQNATITFTTRWFRESTANWSEKAVWPENTFYSLYMYDWFRTPYRSLWDTAPRSREYGSHYWMYLQERFSDPILVKRVFDEICPQEYIEPCAPTWAQASWIEPLNRVLRSRGVDGSALTPFNETLTEFFIWNSITDWVHDDGQHYQDGNHYPTIGVQAQHYTYPVHEGEFQEGNPYLAQQAGSNYIRFRSTTKNTELTVSFDGRLDSDYRRVSFVVTKNGNEHEIIRLSPDAGGDAQLVVPDWHELDYVTMIVTNFDHATADLDFEYTAEETGETVPALLFSVVARPNVFGSSTVNTETVFHYEVKGEAAETVLRLYLLNGRFLRELRQRTTGHGMQHLTWDGRDREGFRVPSGIYLYRLQHGSDCETGKLTVLN